MVGLLGLGGVKALNQLRDLYIHWTSQHCKTRANVDACIGIWTHEPSIKSPQDRAVTVFYPANYHEHYHYHWLNVNKSKVCEKLNNSFGIYTIYQFQFLRAATVVARNTNEVMVLPILGCDRVCVSLELGVWSQAVGFALVDLVGIWLKSPWIFFHV